MAIQTFKDLEVYRRSYKVMIEMYKISKRFPKDEMFGLTSQIKRASVSIPLNIAEGYGKRENVAEFRRFVLMAIGSCDEMKVLIDICRDLEMMGDEVHDRIESEYDEIGRMLKGLRDKWTKYN